MTTRSLQVACIIAAALLFSPFTGVARAQTPPSPLFQNATLTGSGNTITATRVPVALSATLIIFVDIAIQFNSDANGVLSIANGFPQYTASATPMGNFVAGTYLGPLSLFSGNGLISLSGPAVGDAGSTLWSLTTAPGTNTSVYPANANWYVGPIANNPYATRINAAKITSTTYAYGVATSAGNNCAAPWCTGSGSNLIGVSQTGNVLSIATFSYDGGSDQNVPYAVLTFTLQQ